MLRIQENILARPERRLLTWGCGVLPNFVTPDKLTILGIAGAAMVLIGGVLSNWNHHWLWFAGLGLFLNWAGDSLDGSLARYRAITRPRYGYFLDHSVDGLNNFMMLMGLGLTSSIHLSAALLALSGYYLMCIYVFLRRQVMEELQLSFFFMGPTELRLIMLAMTVGMFFSPRAGLVIEGRLLTCYDFLLLFAAGMFLGLFIWFIWKTSRQLRREGAEGQSSDLEVAENSVSA